MWRGMLLFSFLFKVDDRDFVKVFCLVEKLLLMSNIKKEKHHFGILRDRYLYVNGYMSDYR